MHGSQANDTDSSRQAPTPSLRLAFLQLAALSLAACAHSTRITAPDAGTTLHVRDTQLELPASHKLRGTSFGNHEFKAETPGHPPFHGILPLSFRGGHLAVDVFGAPRSSK